MGGGGRGRGSRSKKSRLKLDSDARRGRFHRSNSVKSVGCEEQEKTWTVEWVIKPRGEERGLGTSPADHGTTIKSLPTRGVNTSESLFIS